MKQNASTSKPVKKPVEIINVAADVQGVVCDGGSEALGHPQVWYSFDNTHHKYNISCHYCGRKFVKTVAE